jgi:hypothetical protein
MEGGMHRETGAPLVMPVVSVILSAGEPEGTATHVLAERFGPVALESGPYPFDLSDYYGREMGEGLMRTWLCFSTLRDPSDLPAWKHDCTLLEAGFADPEGRRRVNLDPGYLDHGKLVLASFKSAPDKLYIGSGVWAHTCLRYRFRAFTAPDHSFPDFRDGRFNGFLIEARKEFQRLLRIRSGAPVSPLQGS